MGYVADLLQPLQLFQEPAEIPRDMAVSALSQWQDPIWRFEATTAGSRDVVLRWDFVVSLDSRFTDAEYSGLLEQARRMIWSIMTSSQRGRNPKITSLPDLFWAFRSLLRWMSTNDRMSFSELTPDACKAYLDNTSERLKGREKLTDYTLGVYADTLCRAHEQGTLFQQVPDLAIAVHPFGGMTANQVALRYAPRSRPGFIPAVPDPIHLGSMSAAMDWIDRCSDDVLRVQDLMMEERRSVDRHRSNSYSYHLNAALSGFRFADREPSVPWREPLSRNNALNEARELFNDTRDAAVVVLQGAVGLRMSEVCGMTAGEMSEQALWPTCVTVSPAISGLTELFHLSGRVYKQNDPYREVTWLIGSRPMGSSHVPPAVKAIAVLWKLFRPWRELGGREELVVSLGVARGFPWEDRYIGRILRETLGLAQRSWVEKYVEIPREYLGWQLTSHQWRKSFAMYMIRTDPRMLPTVRDHFKHMSSAMTERGYVGLDPEMLGLLEDEATYAAAQFLFDVANGRPAAGKMMDTIESNIETIRELIGVDGSETDRIDDLAALLKDDDIRVWPSDWGSCLFRCEVARCHFLAKGHFDLNSRRPHYGQRRPGVCCDCANLLIFSDDVDFWQARFKSGLAVYEGNRLAGEYGAAAVAEDRVRTSVAVLRRLGLVIEWNPSEFQPEQ